MGVNQLSIISAEEVEKTSTNELFKKLASSETGLSSSEAEQRLQRYGYNEISEKRTSPIVKLLHLHRKSKRRERGFERA